MTDMPWQGDACSLVDAFRRGERSPREELDAVLAAIDASELNAFSHVHRDEAIAAAAGADVSLPFGGVPIGVKELDQVAGWPDTHASTLYRDAIAASTSTNVARIRDLGGAVLVVVSLLFLGFALMRMVRVLQEEDAGGMMDQPPVEAR